ncbi:MAG: AcrB/AcrD/AcrF family protein [Proteobacteria bacterium]|nr:AcrB/AcrD/AcrF family protein [Pseudomonadota bacterium]NIS69385.1 AcrB/AcrD/AcrF family protein [Pseudomonadota bacterium]
MNIAEWSMRRSVITWVLTILLVVVGWISFNNLPRLEDPEFTIKEAAIYTPYPGASAAEVEEEVTNVIEKACQELGQLDRVESRSSRGLSLVKAIIKDKYDKRTLPQVWDELRRKVNDFQTRLPPGAGPSIVNDDFGDVYGIYVAITGEGYTHKEVYEYAKFLQRQLLQAKDVKRIILYGVIPEAVYVEMRREKMAELGISPGDIYQALGAKNLPASAGNLTLGTEYIPINPTGEFESEQEFGDLLVRSRGPGSESLVYLRDVADIKRGYQEPPNSLLRSDGKPAIGLAISTVLGGNVMTMGESLKKKFKELEAMRPVGMELNVVSLQTDAVAKAIKGFMVNLLEAVAIVIVVLLIFMGLRSGLIIGFILLVTIMGSFIIMGMRSITLERISLGALVIALGMLVDNAIVVTDGMRIRMEQGSDALKAARDVVGQVGMPLLGATFVAVAAFAAIGTSQDSTGEYCRSLFYVILISLTVSWLTAVTSTPLLCKTFLKVKAKAEGTEGGQEDPYAGKFYKMYGSLLSASIRYRWITMAVVVCLFVGALIGFGSVKNSFFPDSTRPQFYVDFWLPEGTDIHETVREMARAEETLLARDGVTRVTTQVGGGSPRFLLTYTPEYPYYSFGRILVDVDDYKRIPVMVSEVQGELETLFPAAIVQVRKFILGPSTGGKIQLRLYGPDSEVLRRLAVEAKGVLLDDPNAKAVRDEWRSKVKVLRPQLAEAQARRAGVERPDLARAVENVFDGTKAGVYRERDELLPIIARAPETERVDLDSLDAIQIWSPAAQQMIPAGQVVTGFKVEFEDPYVWRRNRIKMLKIHADPREGLPSELFARVKPKIEKALGVDAEQILGRSVDSEEWDATTIPVRWDDMLPLKARPGHYMAWGGEAEDSAKATARLSASIPIFFGLMVLIVLFLFNSIRKTLVIWLTVPLSIIGVAVGLLLFNQPFGFMSLLGLMSLSGMLIKNAIVLIDQIGLELESGKAPFQAIVDSGVSRLIPVSMAAMTTILGMMPLLQDAFFIAMAVTIMFGLGFATILTLIVVPVLYAIFFRVPYQRS